MNLYQREQAEKLLPLAYAVARRYGKDDESFSVAQLALCTAVMRYKPEYGVSLRTFCFRYLRQRVLRERYRSRRYITNGEHWDTVEAPGGEDSSPREIPERIRKLLTLFLQRGGSVRGIARAEGVDFRTAREWVNELKEYVCGT